MMGRTSGWLRGTVTHTCVSFIESDYSVAVIAPC